MTGSQHGPESIQYRRARVQDAWRLSIFAAEKFVEAYCEQNEPSVLEAYAAVHFTEDRVRQEISARLSRVLVAEDAGRLAGYALLSVESVPDCAILADKPAQIERIYVDPEWHGRGVGRELLGRCVADARAADCDLLWLAVWESNARAIRFYLKSGFQIVGEQPFVLGPETQRDFVMAWQASG